MHCQSCGAQLRSSARFCNQCGRVVFERFGSAVLPAPEADGPITPTENLAPKIRTAPNPPAHSTLEHEGHLATDQLGLRGTGRQPLTKSTSEVAAPNLDARATVVDAKAFKEAAPTRREPSAKPLQATTIVEAPALLLPPAAPFVPPPKIEQPASAPPAKPAAAQPAPVMQEVEYLTPSTIELQSSVAHKPFFTRMLTPDANPQHKYLIYAVPLVLLATVIVFLVFWWLR